MSGSGISWAMCNSAPRSRQVTTPAPHHWWTNRWLFRELCTLYSVKSMYIVQHLHHSDYAKIVCFSACRKVFITMRCTYVLQRTSHSRASWFWRQLRIQISCRNYILMIQQKFVKLGLVFAWICIWIHLTKVLVYLLCVYCSFAF